MSSRPATGRMLTDLNRWPNGSSKMPILLKGSCRCGAVGSRSKATRRCPTSFATARSAASSRAAAALPSISAPIADTLKHHRQAPSRPLPRRDRGRRAAALRDLVGRAAVLPQMRLGALALRSDLAGAGASLRLGNRQRAAEGAGARSSDAEVQGVLGRARHVRKGDKTFELYPEESIADWHKQRGLWVD